MSLLTSLVGYWQLDEASGSRADAHGGNTLTDNNTVTQNTGKIGSAAQFTAANSETLTRADNAALSTGDIDFTFAAWVYLDSLPALNGRLAILSKYVSAGNQKEYILDVCNDAGVTRFRFLISSTGADDILVKADTFGTPSTATWYYVVAWHDAAANTINIQINNGTVDSLGHSGGVFDSTSAFTMGAFNGGNFFNGRIDEVGMWKQILTAAERTSLYHGGNGFAYPFGVVTFTGAVTPAGVVTRSLARSFAAAITPGGTLTKLLARAYAGTITALGLMAGRLTAVRSFAGAIVPSGTVSRSLARTFAAVLTPAGTIARAIARAFAGAMAVVGALTSTTKRPRIITLTASNDTTIALTATDDTTFDLTASETSEDE